ncbi:hypothetical protein Gotur_022410, partial [Gossypium turneri]
MARLPLIGQSVRRKRIGIALTIWLQICRIANYVKRLINARDETCIEQVRMNRTAFFKLCEMLQMLGGLKSSRNMLVDEQAKPITANSSNPRWKWFKNCLGALDGTHIRIRVSTIDKPRYRTVLRDAISRRHGLKVPHGKGYQPSTPAEFFSMKHASARNVIERCFGLLKLRWGILRSPSFYPVRLHNRIIITCCLLHNFIRTYISIDPIEAELGEGLPSNVIDDDEPNTVNIHPSDAWATWRMELANQMFEE